MLKVVGTVNGLGNVIAYGKKSIWNAIAAVRILYWNFSAQAFWPFLLWQGVDKETRRNEKSTKRFLWIICWNSFRFFLLIINRIGNSFEETRSPIDLSLPESDSNLGHVDPFLIYFKQRIFEWMSAYWVTCSVIISIFEPFPPYLQYIK